MNPDLTISARRAESLTREYCNPTPKPELLSKFSHFNVSRVAEKLAKRFPVSEISDNPPENTFWFTNEYPVGLKDSKLALANTINEIRESCPVNERRVSIITGESGLLSCIPELSRISELIIQVDANPVLLNFIGELLKNLTNVTSISPEKYYETIILSLKSLKRKGFSIDEPESEILKSAETYKEAMGELHCFSSERRFEEFKLALNKFYIQAVEANYFSEKDMGSLFEILVEEGLEVSYFNISNAYEYLHDFYSMNPFDGLVKGVESTIYMRAIPLAEDAVCAYSSLLSIHHHTGTCTKYLFFDRLHQINESRALHTIKLFAGRDKYDVGGIISACVALAKIDHMEVKSAIRFLRLLLAHITRDESIALSSKVAEINHSLTENKMYNSESRNKFMEVIRAAVL